MAGSGGELAKRVGVAAIGIPVTVILAYLGGYWLAALMSVMAGLAAWEFCNMYRQLGVHAAPYLAGFLALSFVLLAVPLDLGRFAVWATVLTLGIAAVLMLRTAADLVPGRTVMVTVFAALYTGLLLAFGYWIRALDGTTPSWRGAAVVMLPVSVTWLGDTAAYSVGRKIGKHKLAPLISPKKTWEGAVAGFVGTAAGALLWVELTRPLVSWTLSIWEVLVFGALVAVAGQVGDLFESRFKRDCGVKDSSSLLPGHGGVLDRVDALLFAFPVAFAYLLMVGV